MPTRRPLALTRLACALLLGAATLSAAAHDTWFQRRPTATPARPEMVLGTGNLFPVVDSRNGIEHLVASGCRAGAVQRSPLVDVDPTVEDLVLGPAQPLPRAARISCWAQQQPFEADFDDELVNLYFKEAAPPPSVVQAWAAQKARGVRWRERYAKHARIEWFPDRTAVETQPAQPSGMAMDALLLSPLRAPKVGDELVFQVLKNGQPLPNFSVEFRVHHSRFGAWRRTDAQGRVSFTAGSVGRWLLRGIELTPPSQDQQPWEGRFVTLAFDVID